jgi:hypothetical protein
LEGFEDGCVDTSSVVFVGRRRLSRVLRGAVGNRNRNRGLTMQCCDWADRDRGGRRSQNKRLMRGCDTHCNGRLREGRGMKIDGMSAQAKWVKRRWYVWKGACLHFQVHPLPSQGGASRKPQTRSLLSGTPSSPFSTVRAGVGTVSHSPYSRHDG